MKECLKLDPDHKECFPFYKKVKKLVKQLQNAQDASNSENWDDCVNKARKIMETESKVYNFVHTSKSHICHCQAKVSQLEHCHSVMEIRGTPFIMLCLGSIVMDNVISIAPDKDWKQLGISPSLFGLIGYFKLGISSFCIHH